jgi:hypothetical protein
MTPAQQLLQEIAAKRAEQARLLAQVDLWAAVQAQRIAIDKVERFGFDETRLTPTPKFAARRTAVRRQPDPVTGELEQCDPHHLYLGERLPDGHYICRVYNYVRHQDGTTTTLNPMLKAV